MTTPDHHRLDQLGQERESIAKSGRLHWIHWSVVALSLLLTIGAWYYTKSEIDQKIAARFERAADQVLALISERMKKYEDGLWGGVSAIQAQGGDITYERWRIFADSLRIDLKYPGINGIGVIHHVPPQRLDAYLENQRRSRPDYGIHPSHDRPDFMPITYIEPADVNAAAVGLDMAHETNRYGAALKARDTGSAQITGPITLVQDESHTPGFLFYAPFYQGGTYDLETDRRDHFVGMVYAPFVFHKLMEGVLGKEQRQVRIRVSDGLDPLYDEQVDTEEGYDPDPLFSTTRDLDLYGRTWTFDIATARSFRDAVSNNQPIFILLCGIIIDSLLFTLFFLLTRANRRAVDFADRMTRELQIKATDLETSNADLEKFAYVTSHDLKTPLRGIGDLIEYLEEDLGAYIEGSDANPDIRKNLQRLQQQATRMDNLINGILEYSSVGTVPERLVETDTKAIVSALRDELDLRDDQIELKGTFPIMTTDKVRFEQVISNLIGNAVKYHHRPDQALVTVGVEEAGDFFLFSVTDDGPGIDPMFHDRIFDVFQTLQSKDEIESTGIGLSIVRKAVESHGGTVGIASTPGQGTTFTFKWPKIIRQVSEKRVAA